MVTRLFLLLMLVTVGCKSCRQPVITGGGYANGHLYHAECFNCAQCGARLDSKAATNIRPAAFTTTRRVFLYVNASRIANILKFLTKTRKIH